MSLAVVTTIYSVIAVGGASVVAVIVARRRGYDKAEAEADETALKLRNDLLARVSLLEQANRDKDATIAAQNATIAGLTAKTATLTAKVDDLELALARERRVTAEMRGETGDGR